jgi:hypothetical protein
MKFKKGNKEGKGRPKGTPNKKTEQWQAFSEYCLSGGVERFQKELNGLKGKQYVDAFLSILEFHKPKLARTELTGEDGEELIPKNITIEIVHKK